MKGAALILLGALASGGAWAGPATDRLLSGGAPSAADDCFAGIDVTKNCDGPLWVQCFQNGIEVFNRTGLYARVPFRAYFTEAGLLINLLYNPEDIGVFCMQEKLA